MHLKWLSLCNPHYLKQTRQNPWSGNYQNHSALKMHYKTQSEETEDQSPLQEEEGGEGATTPNVKIFQNLQTLAHLLNCQMRVY